MTKLSLNMCSEIKQKQWHQFQVDRSSIESTGAVTKTKTKKVLAFLLNSHFRPNAGYDFALTLPRGGFWGVLYLVWKFHPILTVSFRKKSNSESCTVLYPYKNRTNAHYHIKCSPEPLRGPGFAPMASGWHLRRRNDVQNHWICMVWY